MLSLVYEDNSDKQLFMQDAALWWKLDPKQVWFNHHNVKVLEGPPRFSNLNFIENLWIIIICRLCRHSKHFEARKRSWMKSCSSARRAGIKLWSTSLDRSQIASKWCCKYRRSKQKIVQGTWLSRSANFYQLSVHVLWLIAMEVYWIVDSVRKNHA